MLVRDLNTAITMRYHLNIDEMNLNYPWLSTALFCFSAEHQHHMHYILTMSNQAKSSFPIGFSPAFLTFSLFFSNDSLGSFLICASVVVCSSPSCASLGSPRRAEMGDCMLLDGGASVYLDSLPRETFMPSDSGLLAGEGLALVACSAVAEVDKRWILAVGTLCVSIFGLLIDALLYFFFL